MTPTQDVIKYPTQYVPRERVHIKTHPREKEGKAGRRTETEA